jgi:hypothetical protein
MQLSEAMILGSMLHPQAFGEFIDEDGNACALQAVMDAVSDEGELSDKKLEETFPILRNIPSGNLPRHRVKCPACIFPNRQSVKNLIMHLNDGHEWTRERIAEHIQKLELKWGYGAPQPQDPDPYRKPEPITPKHECVALGAD